MKGNIYNSSTHGHIPLSMEARTLMEKLRTAATDSVRQGIYSQELAHARGELAQYMSKLEKRASWEAFKTKASDSRVQFPARLTFPKDFVSYFGSSPYIDEKGGMTATEVNMRQEAERLAGRRAQQQRIEADARRFASGVDWALPGSERTKAWWAECSAKLKGNSISMVICDEAYTLKENLDMSKKAVAARKRVDKALAKVRAAKAAKMMPVGVRFLTGPNLAKIYTYRAARAAKLHLGQEVVVRNDYGTNVGVVVALDGPIPNGWVLDTLVELTRKVAAI